MFRPRAKIVVALLMLSFSVQVLTAPEAPAQQSPSEYQVKAAYLFNFLKFVEWPGQSPGDAAGPWLICVVGDNPFGNDLAQVVSGKSAQGHELLVKDSLPPADLHACHILFISTSEKKRLPTILAALKGSSTLTVADMENFTGAGGGDSVRSGGWPRAVCHQRRGRFRGRAESQLEIIVARAIGYRQRRKRQELKWNGPANFRCAARSRW